MVDTNTHAHCRVKHTPTTEYMLPQTHRFPSVQWPGSRPAAAECACVPASYCCWLPLQHRNVCFPGCFPWKFRVPSHTHSHPTSYPIQHIQRHASHSCRKLLWIRSYHMIVLWCWGWSWLRSSAGEEHHHRKDQNKSVCECMFMLTDLYGNVCMYVGVYT